MNTPKKTTTTRRKPAAKSTAKSTRKAGPARGRKTPPKKKTWLQKLWSIGWKLGLVFIAFMVAAGFYLNGVVTQRFTGQLFELPTVVYARVMTLEPGSSQTITKVRQELDVLNYRKVANPMREGEYSASSTKIELFRRPFTFENGPEPARHVMMYFDNNGLKRIQSLESKADLGFLRIEPKMLGMLEAKKQETRLFLKREQFPEAMVAALLSTEDRDFYQHGGVAPLAIARAFVVNLKAGRAVQGGSTLTQQLAKNLFLSSEKTLWRKFKEAYIAVILDYRFSKDKILEAYLNEVYLGQNGGEAIHGFALASRYYFGQPLQELRIDQLAMLVGMVKGPSYYNPIRHPERTQERRDLVLELMMTQNILTASQYNQAVSRDLDLQNNPHLGKRQPAYFEQLQRELKDKVGDKFKADTGLRLFTTLDPVSQTYLEQAVTKTLPQLEQRSGKGLQTAVVAVDRQTGEIRAMIGGRNSGFDGFNRALSASRQIGSLVKPSVYLTALEQPEKYNLGTTIADKPITLTNKQGKTWSPKNYDRKFRGEVPLYQAMARSLNVPTVNLGMQLGIPAVMETLTKLGIDKQEIRPVPSMFLGSFTLTPYQVSQMFQTITNSGKRAPLTALRTVMDVDGNVLYESIPRASQQVPQQAAWLTTYIMKKVVSEGTSRSLQGQYGWATLAAKTGTSNDSRDSWFVGVDGREVVTIWTGRDDNKPTKLTGASGSLKTYANYLAQRAPERLTLPWPSKIVTTHFEQTQAGGYQADCGGDIELPQWDVNGDLKDQCKNNPSRWLKSLFDF
ncbi:penicillin-binding protein 1B [Vibrio litoralis]|uniref:penicillin-binding protein 1B n=1 Tax=Vibrio litoralis TaxID=335972 RepID=UPI00042A538D|nr:penicillin-binding protein 1B [Vibrio litoralis]